VNQRIIYWVFLKALLILSLGCYKNNSSEKVASEIRNKILESSSISYNYKSITDNRFNETTYLDSAAITYYKLDFSLHGFGLHALSKNEEYFFDGYNFEKIKPIDKIRVKYNKDEIKNDSAYFYNLSFFASNPMSIKDHLEFDTITKMMIENKHYYLYKNEEQHISKSDSSEIVKYQKIFYSEVASGNIQQIQDLTIRNDETLQVIDHYFTDYIYKTEPSSVPRFDPNDDLKYKTITEEEEYEAFSYTPIKAGETLARKTYTDIEEKEVSIYGEQQKTSLIMFSFIGCAPCEVALRDFKDSGYWFTDEVDLFYSSFQNTGPSLKKYLAKKEFPFKAFGKESEMIQDFSLYHAPSFVFIDSNGKVLKVVEGYDEEVKKTLFDIIKSKK